MKLATLFLLFTTSTVVVLAADSVRHRTRDLQAFDDDEYLYPAWDTKGSVIIGTDTFNPIGSKVILSTLYPDDETLLLVEAHMIRDLFTGENALEIHTYVYFDIMSKWMEITPTLTTIPLRTTLFDEYDDLVLKVENPFLTVGLYSGIHR